MNFIRQVKLNSFNMNFWNRNEEFDVFAVTDCNRFVEVQFYPLWSELQRIQFEEPSELYQLFSACIFLSLHLHFFLRLLSNTRDVNCKDFSLTLSPLTLHVELPLFPPCLSTANRWGNFPFAVSTFWFTCWITILVFHSPHEKTPRNTFFEMICFKYPNHVSKIRSANQFNVVSKAVIKHRMLVLNNWLVNPFTDVMKFKM